MSADFDRRAFFGSLTAFAAYAMAGQARAAGGAMDRRVSARRWIDRQDEIAKAFQNGEVTPLAWRTEVADLARRLDVAQFVAELKRSKLDSAGEPFRRDPAKQYVRFVDENGRRRRVAFGAALFTFTPANVITPHAHKHMASAHMVVEGRVRIRTYDREGETRDSLILRATGDHVAGVGEASAMTTPKDNVHWFTPKSERAATFDVILSGLDPGQPDHVIQPVHPLSGYASPHGHILAPILSFERSMDLYSPDL